MSAEPPTASARVSSLGAVAYYEHAGAAQIMADHARTFHWASRLMPRASRSDIEVLYAFCRFVDDLGDRPEDRETARAGLSSLLDDIAAGRSRYRIVSEYLSMAARRGIPIGCAQELIRGVASDIGQVRIANQRELLRYSYRVASTVGLMYCAIHGVKDAGSLAYAIDLGLGMQLTNIARDVVEDWRVDRAYLPATWVPADRIDRAVAGEDPMARSEVLAAVHRLLALADSYYRSADRGMCVLPWRARWAALTASRAYEAIGVRILARGADYWSGRTFTTSRTKLYHTLAAGCRILFDRRYRSRAAATDHDARLHADLAGLPGADA